MEWLTNFEGDILLWIQNNLRGDILDIIMKFITSLGDIGLVWILSAVVMICFKKTRKCGIIVLMSLLGSIILNNLILKNLFQRTRPYEVIEGLTSLIGKQSDYSFPSGHTGSSIAASVVMLKCLPKKLSVPALILGVLISLSRLYIGVHFPTDVLVGAIMGGISAFISVKVYNSVENKVINGR